MKTFIQPGENLTVAAPYDRESGEAMLVGALVGVAQEKVTAGDDVVMVRRGVFEHAKTSAQAWTVGAKIYWDDTNKVFTTAASGNTLCGAAVEVAANPSATGKVLLDGAVR
jgi:predicted RecA/RadA family phage recombinase